MSDLQYRQPTYADLIQQSRDAYSAGDMDRARQLGQQAMQLRGSQEDRAQHPLLERAQERRNAPPMEQTLGQISQSFQSRLLPQEPESLARMAAEKKRVNTAGFNVSMPEAPEEPMPRENEWLGGVMPSPRQAVRNLRENLIGDDDPTTLNRGERLASALNKAGESMTMGVIGDEAAGLTDHMLQRGHMHDRIDFYRQQEKQLQEQHPGLNLAAEIGGAVIGPGKGVGALVNRGVGTGARIARGTAAGTAAGSLYGAAEGEDAESRVVGGTMGAILGGVTGGTLTGLGQGFNRTLQAFSRRPELQELVPTVEGLKEAAQGLYRRAEASGATIPADRMAALLKRTTDSLRQEGYHPRIQKKVAPLLDEMQAMSANPQSLRDLSLLRRIAGNVAQSTEPDERRLGAMVIDGIDDTIGELGGGSKHFAEAKDIWARMRRLEAVESIIEDASNSPNFEQALQTKFRAMLRNQKRLRGFSEAEKRAMGVIARGSLGVKGFKALGKLLSANSPSGIALAGGATYAAGPAGLALPVAGAGAKAIANALVRGQTNRLRNATGMSAETRKIVEALLKEPNRLAPGTGIAAVGAGSLAERLK